ncbi:hypothetical protein BJX68DRAFT_278147 [Aspergillus pseudodeflectus]|uniref:Alpha/beta hydrolase fold-3 domain-containing protein n=1 Tax=Aspergillus pseudodeflectus TaxID=176178 RepID=A0ABR4JSR4_9EURO
MYSLSDLLNIANPIRAFGLKSYSVTTHPNEVLQIPSQDKGRFIRIHAYNTLNRATPAPVLVNFHGSGFVNPLHGSDDQFCKYIVKTTGFAMRFRLVLSYLEKFNTSWLLIPGFSVGGILSLVLSLNTEKTAPDTSIDPAPVELLDAFIQCYYANPEDVKTKKFLGRIFLVTPLGNRIRNETNKHIEMHRYEGCEHAFDKDYAKGSIQERAKDDIYERAAAFLT